MDISPALIKAIGKPVRHLGIGASASLSLMPAKRIIAMAKPTDAPIPFTRDSIKLYPLSILSTATPSTAQLVVIRGRYTPRA